MAFWTWLPGSSTCRLSLMTDLALKPDVSARRAEVRAFMEEHVYPNEAALAREDESADAVIEELRAKAKDAGIWAPHLPPEAGGRSTRLQGAAARDAASR